MLNWSFRFQRQANSLFAEPLYLTKYIERVGTGTGDMIRHCREAGLPEPQFRVTDGFALTIPRPPVTTRQTARPLGEKLGDRLGETRDRSNLEKCLALPPTWRDMADMRNLLSDEYFGVNARIV